MSLVFKESESFRKIKLDLKKNEDINGIFVLLSWLKFASISKRIWEEEKA